MAILACRRCRGARGDFEIQFRYLAGGGTARHPAEAKLRKYLFDWRVLASVAVCATIVAPHAYWIVNNLGHATGVTVAEMKEGADSALLPHAIQGLVSLAVAALKGVALTLAVFGLLFYADLGKILRAESLWTRVVGRMIVACFLMIAFIVVAMDATHIRAKWLALFTALLPLYLTLKIDAAGLDPARRLPALFSISGILSVGVIVMLWARVFVGPMIGDYSFAHTPYNGFARMVRADPDPPPVAIVVDDRIVAGNLRIQFPDTPIILTGFSQEAEKHLPPGRILAAWSAEGKGRQEMPPRITALLQLMPVRTPTPSRRSSQFLTTPGARATHTLLPIFGQTSTSRVGADRAVHVTNDVFSVANEREADMLREFSSVVKTFPRSLKRLRTKVSSAICRRILPLSS